METHDFLDALEHNATAMADAAGRAAPDTPVPSCPGWLVRDLVRHTGGVHRWATGYVGGPRTEMWDVDLDEVVGEWPSDADLIPWLRSGVVRLVDVIRDAPPDLECWTFLRAPSPREMWARRQSHETAIHRADAELAAGSTVEFPASFAADGIDELLGCFITRRRRGPVWDRPARIRFTTDDAAGDWLVAVGPDGVTTTAAGDAGSDCHVVAGASDLYQVVWNRRGPDAVTVSGDDSLIRRFLDEVHIRWS